MTQLRMMLRTLTRRLLVLSVALALAPISGCATSYRAEAIEGWVVDAETNKPLEGVNIVTHWTLKGGMEGGTAVEALQILETVTDQNGRYSFPAWGPKAGTTTGELRGNSPSILLFKPGYRAGEFSNLYSETTGAETFFYNKKTLKLEPFRGTLQEYARHLNSSLNGDLWKIGFSIGEHSGNFCGWKSFPRMLNALAKLEYEYRSAGVVQGTVVSQLQSNNTHIAAAGCGALDEVITR
jgi:hypothetical protein